VVIVILAILAAALVPALLGYIDEARKSSYNEEAHSILTALQVVEDEKYAANVDPITTFQKGSSSSDAKQVVLDRVNRMIDPTKLITATVTMKETPDTTKVTHGEYTIKDITELTFVSEKSKSGKCVKMKFVDNTWELVDENADIPS
ncbi:MAG: hypothetical protein K6F77_08945, partial [Lachnospiraceae bacterium]|nr:hypothetical protein [Lachnospiraceae bacterium]